MENNFRNKIRKRPLPEVKRVNTMRSSMPDRSLISVRSINSEVQKMLGYFVDDEHQDRKPKKSKKYPSKKFQRIIEKAFEDGKNCMRIFNDTIPDSDEVVYCKTGLDYFEDNFC